MSTGQREGLRGGEKGESKGRRVGRGLCIKERRAGELRMLQAPCRMPAGCSTALGPSSLSPEGARQCCLPISPAGIRTPLLHKQLYHLTTQCCRARTAGGCFCPLHLQCSIPFTSFQQKKAERRESACQRHSLGKNAEGQTPGNEEYAARKSNYLKNRVLTGISRNVTPLS